MIVELSIILLYSLLTFNHSYYACFRCSCLELIQIIYESEANGDCLQWRER